jgi:hypothetical protein
MEIVFQSKTKPAGKSQSGLTKQQIRAVGIISVPRSDPEKA